MQLLYENKRNYIKIKPLLDKGFEIIGNHKKQELLSDTKLTEDIVQFVFGGYFAGYLAQIVEAGAYIEGYEVAGDVVVHAGLNILQRLQYFLQRTVVAGIGDNGAFLFYVALRYQVV